MTVCLVDIFSKLITAVPGYFQDSCSEMFYSKSSDIRLLYCSDYMNTIFISAVLSEYPLMQRYSDIKIIFLIQ